MTDVDRSSTGRGNTTTPTADNTSTHIVLAHTLNHLGHGATYLFRHRVLALVSLVAVAITTGLFIRPRALQQPFQDMALPYAVAWSPNCDDRPPGAVVNCIVLHATVEPTTEGTMNIFLTPARRVSAHFVVGRDGRVVQMVPVERRAWHAGSSILDDVGSVNNFSVGIEMVNLNDGKDPYTHEQMEAVAGIIRLTRSRYDIPDERIVSHAQIARPAGRKTDPVAFDFEKIRAMARTIPPAQSPVAAPITAVPAPAAGPPLH